MSQPNFRRFLLMALALGFGIGLWFASSVFVQPGAPPTPADPSSSTLSGRALTSSLAQLEEGLPGGTGRVVILRDGRILEDVPFAGRDLRYTDYLLWPSTTSRY